MSQAPARADIAPLEARARRIRRQIVEMVATAQSGHPGGSLSAVELLVGLFFHQMRYDPQQPNDPNRDRFLLSKGHATPVFYATLAEAGFFDPKLLAGFRTFGSPLQGHPSLRDSLPGVEVPGGSLGHGLGLGLGMALANRLDDRLGRVYVLLGDGELQEGEVWESAMAAAHYRVSSLTAIVDANGIQQDGLVRDVMNIEPLVEKWQAFGWEAREIDGHDLNEVLAAYHWATGVQTGPAVIVARTVKGRGVSYMENSFAWHGKAPSGKQLEQARAELDWNGVSSRG